MWFACLPAQAEIHLTLPEYQPLSDKALVQGTLASSGSTTLSPILEIWMQDFSRIYPDVKFTMEAEGSGSAPRALMAGTANIGAMSRPIKAKEIEKFEELKYYKPTEIKVALDALGVIVNTLNPINEISLKQLDAIYSVERKCGYPQAITEWEELGWDTPIPISIYFFDANSGGAGFFSSKTLCGGEYKKHDTPLQETSAEMAEAISKQRFAIGFASMTTINNQVKTLKVSKSRQHPGFSPNATHIPSGDYPYARYLYIYLDKRPDSKLPLFIQEFVKYIFSRQGQRTALHKGSFPLSPTEIGNQLNRVLN
ncbi:MAG: PstS family phosphate ABC transporter substrate-binding protein [Thiolinea sp.]